jgi:hypothetical protein
MTQVFSDAAYLLQTEIRLARAEIGEKLSRAASGGILIGIGAVLLLPGIFVLLLSVVRWLQVAGVPEQWGLLLVGAVTVGIGVALAVAGANSLKGSALVPERTIQQLGADVSVAKEHVL